MNARWRARTLGLAIVVGVAGAAGAAWGLASAQPGLTLAIIDPDGGELARVRLAADGTFALRYRNSLYGSLVEERYAAGADGQIRLQELAADERAVLEEYYAVAETTRRAPASDARTWTAPPARPVALAGFDVAATDLSERTLLVNGAEPIELWRLAADGDSILELSVVVP